MKKDKKLQHEFLKAFEIRMNLCGKAERRWFWAAFFLLVLYGEFVVLAHNTALGYIDSPFLNVLQAVIVIPLCFLCLLAVSKWNIFGESRRVNARSGLRRRLLFAVVVWVLTFSLFFLCQRAYWPGIFCPDNIGQYEQAITGNYTNWHPVMHTWIFFRLPLLLFHSPAGIVFLQILWFSLAVTYLFYVLYISGCPKAFLVCGWLYIVANPNTLTAMMIPWKDSALTIFSTVIFAQLVRIYLTKGDWLKKWYNFASFSVFAFLALEMRHNALLLIIPIFAVLLFSFKSARKRVALSAAIVYLSHLLLYGPVFSLMNVSLPGLRTVEATGLPMTVLSDIYVQDRESLNEEIRTFMDSVATRETWDSYILGNFNSIKWRADLIHVEGTTYKKIFPYAADAAMKRPDLAWKAFCLLTRIVWEVDSGYGWDFSDLIKDKYSDEIYYDGDVHLRDVFNTYTEILSAHSTRYLFRYTGGIILVLLFLAVGHLGGGNLCRSLLILAPMAYNFGTMLLLTGPDFRFFHFNCVIVVPLIYLMLRRKETSNNDEN